MRETHPFIRENEQKFPRTSPALSYGVGVQGVKMILTVLDTHKAHTAVVLHACRRQQCAYYHGFEPQICYTEFSSPNGGTPRSSGARGGFPIRIQQR